MERREFKPTLNRGVVLQIIAIAIFSSLLLFEGAESLRTTLESVNHADQVIGEARDLLKLNIDMETGVRGFLFTGRPVFLQPYNEAAQVVDSRVHCAQPTHLRHFVAASATGNHTRERRTVESRKPQKTIEQRALGGAGDSEDVRYGKMLQGKAAMDTNPRTVRSADFQGSN